ncbi:MAG: DUF63 family protein [Halobacteriaceae archaeon]
MVLPAGTSVPPLPYLAALLIGTLAVGVALVRARPPVTEMTILGVAPWMVAGGTLYVAYQLSLLPSVVAPFFGSPAVYVTSFLGAGLVWLGALLVGRSPPPVLAISGTAAAVPPTIVAVRHAESLQPTLPLVGTVAAGVVAGLLWWLLRAWEPQVEVLGWAGTLTVFAHALDAFTTAVGVVHLGFGERTPLSRFLLEAVSSAPIPLLGSAWLFVAVKLLLGLAVAWLLAPTVRTRPREGYLILAVVIAVGLGPGAHNALLFTTVAP